MYTGKQLFSLFLPKDFNYVITSKWSKGTKGPAKDVVIKKSISARAEDGKDKPVEYVRRRADGGIFTADQAKEFGLIDQIGYLEDAVAEARKMAGPGQDYRVITYDRPQTLMGALLGVKTAQTANPFGPGNLAAGSIPRLWYLAPQSELAGLLTSISRNNE